MQNETASTAFWKFGSVLKNISSEVIENYTKDTRTVTSQRYLSQFLHFSCDVYIEIQSGIGVLLISYDPETKPIEKFGMNQRIHIKPNAHFAIAASTAELVYDIYVERSFSMDATVLSTPYEYQPVLPRIHVLEILGYYYRIRTPGYRFRGEKHNFFELTYVDTGTLYTEVDGVTYQLCDKELIIYGPGQFHTQYTGEDHSVSYVTIMFTMECDMAELPRNWYEVLVNKVFHYEKKIYVLMKNFVQESSTGAPYMDSLMHCLLTETIIRLLQAEYTPTTSVPARVSRQNYQDELFERIVSYIENKICEPLTVAEICQKFSLSRSSLQLLFKNSVNQSPKKFISDMKLEKSCQMLRENKYTISEISLKLGYSSIHYFSNAFNQKYHISPSEYAKRLC